MVDVGRETNTAVGAAVLAAAGVTLADAERADARPACGETLPECPAPPTPPVTTPPAETPPRQPPARKPSPPGPSGANGPAAPANPGGAGPHRVGRQATPPGSQKFPDLGPARRTDGPGAAPRRTPDPPADPPADDPWADHFDAGGPGAAPGDPPQPYARTVRDLYTPMETGQDQPRTHTPARSQADARREVNRVLRRVRREAGDNPWADFYTQPIQAPVQPAPSPRTMRDMDPKERDEAILNPLAAPLFTDEQRAGARQRQERVDARRLRGVLRRQVTRDVDGNALPALLARPMQLLPRQIDDPVLRDVLCVTDGLRRCRRERALTQLELDVLREAGVLSRAEDPDPGRRDSTWFEQREREHREDAAEAAARALMAGQPTAENPPDFTWGGFAGGVFEHGKGLYVSSFQRSPLGLMTNPKEFAKENWNFAKGAGEGLRGIWDTGVMGWHMSPVGCQVDPEGCKRQYDEIERVLDYAKEDPKAFARELALAMANYEDLRDGRYSEWAGNLAPDAVLAALTYGSGAAVNGGLRGVRTLDNLPVPPRTRALLATLDRDARSRIDVSPESLERLEGMLLRASAGVGRRRYLPTRVSSGASEIRTWRELLRRSGVRRVYVIPETNVRNRRTPDYVAEGRFGRLRRVEATVISVGRGSRYQDGHSVRAEDLPSSVIVSRISGKINKEVTQFNSRLTVAGRRVPTGGELSLHLRRESRRPGTRQSRAEFDRSGDRAMAAAREAIHRSRESLLKAKVRTVDVNLGGRTVRYRVKRNGRVVEVKIRQS